MISVLSSKSEGLQGEKEGEEAEMNGRVKEAENKRTE